MRKKWNRLNLCFFLGHKWSNDHYKKICLRKDCNGTKILMEKKNPQPGESSLDWHYYNIDDINI